MQGIKSLVARAALAWGLSARVFEPRPFDVSFVRFLLVFRLGLPTELADMVIEAAEYYPIMHHDYTEPYVLGTDVRMNYSAGALPLITPVLPSFNDGKRLSIKKVMFWFESHDQGWGGESGAAGSYHSSYTWFEACILRPSPHQRAVTFTESSSSVDLARRALQRSVFSGPEDERFKALLRKASCEMVGTSDGKLTWHVQSNITASSDWKAHSIIWQDGDDSSELNRLDDSDEGRGHGHEFVSALQAGDMVGVWCRAMYPGWANYVNKMRFQAMVRC